MKNSDRQDIGKQKGHMRFSVRTKILMLAAMVVFPFLLAIFYLLLCQILS